MRDAFPKVYRSFEEFEREELQKLDRLYMSVDDMLDEMFSDELDFDEDDEDKPKRRRGRPARTDD
jgi:hypothetical protein